MSIFSPSEGHQPFNDQVSKIIIFIYPTRVVISMLILYSISSSFWTNPKLITAIKLTVTEDAGGYTNTEILYESHIYLCRRYLSQLTNIEILSRKLLL